MQHKQDRRQAVLRALDAVSYNIYLCCASRIVSRGKIGSRASDYGGLEVFGKASIGNTDPYRVFAALQAQLQSL